MTYHPEFDSWYDMLVGFLSENTGRLTIYLKKLIVCVTINSDLTVSVIPSLLSVQIKTILGKMF